MEKFEKKDKPAKHLVFLVGKARFAIPLSLVREVIAMTTITKLPSVYETLEGVFNLRGKIITVADLRRKLSFSAKTVRSQRPCIISVDIDGMEVGNIVDDVAEVVAYTKEQLSAGVQDHRGSDSFRDYIKAIAKDHHGQLTVIVDLKCLLKADLGAERLGEDIAGVVAEAGKSAA